MSKKERREESKVIRCLKSPIRVLRKARDFYIKSMTKWAEKFEHGGGVAVAGAMGGAPTAQVSDLPKSFSISSASRSNCDEDLRELIRAASSTRLENKVQPEILRRRQGAGVAAPPKDAVPRSRSVAIGRIEEDKCYDFENDHMVKVTTTTDVVPRSKSHGVTRRSAKGRF